ncbi:hypothetical protein EG827_05710 [bacterium]|nr:hypothetical protein [bacterium]
MKKIFFTLAAIPFIFLSACTPSGLIARHDFGSGYYGLKSEKAGTLKVYADVYEDTLVLYQMKSAISKEVDLGSGKAIKISSINPDDDLYGARFIKNSVELDLSTIPVKFRPSSSGVPVQINSNLNALLYMGARKDYFIVRSLESPVNRNYSSIKQFGFDFGVFAGLGITPVNPSVTNDNISIEYDGVVFQKGIGAFISVNYISVGITLGFDNLMSSDSKTWIYNNRPYIGLALGIANF